MTTTPDAASEEEGHPSWISRLPWLRLFAEFGVIFLGITLSLMADDWRQSQVDRETERQSLQEVLADLKADSSNLEGLRDAMAVQDEDAVWVFSRLGDSGVDIDSALVRIRSLHNSIPFEAPSAAYVGIRSTGQLGLIRNDAVRREIVEYYEESQPYIRGLHDAYGDVWFAFTEALAGDLEYPPGAETSFFGGRGFRLTRPWTDIPTNPMLRFRLSTLGVLTAVVSNRADQVLNRNTALQGSIRAVLER